MAVVVLFTFFAAVGVWLTGPKGVPGSSGTPKPSRLHNPVGGYTIEVSRDGSSFMPHTIDEDGATCLELFDETDPGRVCLLATNLLPSVIGGAAYGRLNTEETPSLDALIWRARSSGDPGVCARGGLEGAYRTQCEADAIASDYLYSTSDGLGVRIPIGGALSSPGVL